MMKDYAMRIALIVQDLNRYTRASRIVEKSRRDANVIIAETLKLVRQSNPRAENVEIIVETVDDCPVCMMNPLEISQVLTNLLNNAIDSLYERRLNEPEAKAQIKVKTAVRADRVEISVEDNGLGIPKDALPQIFNPFFSTKRYGSGLGLALSEKIVNDHDGEIIVDTEEGKYTVFTVSLPALK
jgi:two-component system sporulation sensor kinase A/two-component system, sporulation sensor kinase E